jgi:anti-anti-sigma factor
VNPPSAPAASYEIARSGTTVVVRAVGLANMKNAPVIDGFLGEVLAGSVTTICIDLSACTGMDSTFMGVLVGRSQQMATQAGRLVIVNPNPNSQRLLSMLGIDQVIPVIAGMPCQDLQFTSLTGRESVPPRERLELIKRAHEDLVALSDANQSKFGAFLQALERDLNKLQ